MTSSPLWSPLRDIITPCGKSRDLSESFKMLCYMKVYISLLYFHYHLRYVHISLRKVRRSRTELGFRNTAWFHHLTTIK